MENAMVIGVRSPTETSPGNFGRFHAINLAQRLDTDRLIVTSTTDRGARINQKFFGAMLGSGAKEIIGIKVSNRGEFEGQLDLRKIDLVVVSAKAPGNIGDSIHVDYVISGLNHPSNPFVLCEKPYTKSDEEGAGIRRLGELDEDSKGRFDLHLPVYLIFQQAARQSPELMEAMIKANKVEICWAVEKDSPAFIIDNLGPHAWSAVGADFTVNPNLVRINRMGKDAVVYATLSKPSGSIDCEMDLSYQFSFRGANFGGFAVEVETVGAINSIYRIYPDPKKGFLNVARKQEYRRGEKIAVVDNPLASFIGAGIAKKPIVGIDRAVELQTFLQQSYELARNR